jgi:hypothetical protein
MTDDTPERRRVTPRAVPSEELMRDWETLQNAGRHVATAGGERCFCWCGEQHTGEVEDSRFYFGTLTVRDMTDKPTKLKVTLGKTEQIKDVIVQTASGKYVVVRALNLIDSEVEPGQQDLMITVGPHYYELWVRDALLTLPQNPLNPVDKDTARIRIDLEDPRYLPMYKFSIDGERLDVRSFALTSQLRDAQVILTLVVMPDSFELAQPEQ